MEGVGEGELAKRGKQGREEGRGGEECFPVLLPLAGCKSL